MLNKTELEVLELLIQGNSYTEISSKMNIAQHLIKNYSEAIYKKIGVTNRVQAAIKYINMQI